MRPLHVQALVATLILLAAGSAAAQVPDPHAGHAAPAPSPHAGHGGAGMEMNGMSTPGMDVSGGATGGMTMSGMTPPAPLPPPPGAILTLNAADPSSPPAVRGSPGRITLAFGRPTTLHELVLTNAVGQQVPTHATLPESPVQSLTFPVTIPLLPGDYQLAWDAADSGPLRRGRLAFAVLQADGSAAPAAPTGHHHH